MISRPTHFSNCMRYQSDSTPGVTMSHVLKQLLALAMAGVAIGCSPPPPVELTATQEALVGRCLELEYKQETDTACDVVTEAMGKAFLLKHPDFYEQLIAARKKFVEDRIAEDTRQRDELNRCLDDHEAANDKSPACEKFMAHEIARGIEDRRRRRCASASLEGDADASQRCAGLAAQEIEAETRLERSRRERRL